MIDQHLLAEVENDRPSRQTGRPERTQLRHVLLFVGIVVAWAGAVLVATNVHLAPSARRPSLFVHLAGLIMGFGAVLVADLFGLLWITGRRPMRDVLDVISVLHIPIWLGLAALVGSGMMLHPDLAKGRVRVKMVLVLVAALNGFWVHTISRRLKAVTSDRPPRALMARAFTAACISQIAWWGSTIVGLLSTTARRS